MDDPEEKYKLWSGLKVAVENVIEAQKGGSTESERVWQKMVRKLTKELDDYQTREELKNDQQSR